MVRADRAVELEIEKLGLTDGAADSGVKDMKSD